MMVLKIETVPDGQHTIFRLSGRIESHHVQDLKARTEGMADEFIFDLEEVKLVDLDAVHFFAVCEANGIQLLHCRPNIREWILAEKARTTERA
jgi:anti-anti-sigma regulatory factor